MCPAQPVPPPAELQVAHTADLEVSTRRAARALLDDVFDDMTDEDWDHSLGGMHALLWEDAELIGHASVIQRQLRCGAGRFCVHGWYLFLLMVLAELPACADTLAGSA